MKTTTVKGTRDYLPAEAQLRGFIQNRILETYREAGFNQIITPILEDIDNLLGSEGGDNLNLMFKVLKRGGKLESAAAGGKLDSLADIGLRYDLTLPLSRYYANNRAKLVFPMKCIQIGNAYRAENPQRGRYREFVQCDIDILGVSKPWAEAELITTTAKALTDLGIGDFRVRINNRQILSGLFLAFGFAEKDIPGLCVSFDKLDKIGADGVAEEIGRKGFASDACAKLIEFINEKDYSLEKCVGLIGESEDTESVKSIIEAVNSLADGQYSCDFDITLVRGQGYYTGAVFEIESLAYSGSLAGGGRYDNLIGKFIGEKVPAVGFSIGFERIFDLLSSQGFTIPDSKPQIAVFFGDDYAGAYKAACGLKENYSVSIFEKPKKLGKFLDTLEKEGCAGYFVAGQSDEVKLFGE